MYGGEEDKDAVLSLRQWQEDIYTAYDAREEHMAKLIRGELSDRCPCALDGSILSAFWPFAEMTGRTQQAEKRATPPEPPEAHQRRVDDLDAEKNAFVDQIDKCTTQAQCVSPGP